MLKFKTLTLLIGFLVLLSCENVNKTDRKTSNSDTDSEKIDEIQPTFGIVIHGGAGTILKENMSDSLENAYQLKLEETAAASQQFQELRRDYQTKAYCNCPKKFLYFFC